MPTQHKTSRHELTPVERAYLVGRHDAGDSFDKISDQTGIPKSTIADTIHNAQERSTTKSLPRTGPCKTDARTDRRLYHEVHKGRQGCRVPFKELQSNFQPQLSLRTIQRRLQEHNTHKWLAKDRPQLTPEHKKAHYQWALEHRYWKSEEWKKVLWTDECLVEKQYDKSPIWVFRTPQEK
jgi:Transposase